MQQDDVNLWHEHENQRHDGRQWRAQALGDDLHFTAVVDWKEGEPDDARRVNRKADEFRLVKVLGNVSGLDGEEDVQQDEDKDESERREYG